MALSQPNGVTVLVLPAPVQHRHAPDEILAAFRLFDPDNSGCIPVREFRDAMSRLAGLPDAEIDDIVAEALLVSRAEAAKRSEQREAKEARKAARRAARAAAAASPVASSAPGHAHALAAGAGVGGSGAPTQAGAGLGGLPLLVPVPAIKSPLESPCMPGELVVATARQAAEKAIHGDSFAVSGDGSRPGDGDSCRVAELYAAAAASGQEPAPPLGYSGGAGPGCTDIEEGAGNAGSGAGIAGDPAAAAAPGPAVASSAEEAVIYYETFMRALFSY